MNEIAVWWDSRGMLYLESEVERYRNIIVGAGSCKNRYQMVKYLKGWNLYEEYKARRKKMTNGFKERDWQMLCRKFGQWKDSELCGPNAMFAAYKRPSAEKVHHWHVYNYEMACCRIVGYPGQQMFSVAGLIMKEGRKFFRTYIGSSFGVRMLEAPYDLLWNNK